MSQQSPNSKENHKLRSVLGQFPTGVAIVTAVTEDCQPIGMTINSFSTVSLTPPLVSWCIDHRAASYRAFLEVKNFTITVLAKDQVDLAVRFATKGVNKFWDIESGSKGAPVIPNGCAWFKCRTFRSISLGDHRMFIGEIIEFASKPIQPLVFMGGHFQQLANSVEVATRAAA